MPKDVLDYATPPSKQPTNALSYVALAWSLVAAVLIGFGYPVLRQMTNSRLAANALLLILFVVPLVGIVLSACVRRDAGGRGALFARIAFWLSCIELLVASGLVLF